MVTLLRMVLIVAMVKISDGVAVVHDAAADDDNAGIAGSAELFRR